MLKIDNKALEFILKDENENEISLSNFEGKNVLLSFHPLAWTSICADQMIILEENYSRFEKLNTVPFGISVDPVPSKKAWKKDLGIKKLILLSDFWPHGEIAKKYDLFLDEKGISKRANVLINDKQEIEFIKIYPITELPDIEEIFKYLMNKH